MPAVPLGQGTIALEKVRLGLVLLFLFPANRATRQNDAAGKIVEV